MTAPVPHCQSALGWLEARGWDLGPLTHRDVDALAAIAHCWQLLWPFGVADPRPAVDAVACLLDGCQEVAWPMARELVAHAGEWHHRDEVWPMVVQQFVRRLATRPDSFFNPEGLERARRIAHCHEGHPQVQP